VKADLNGETKEMVLMYLNINEIVFDKYKKEAKEKAIEFDGDKNVKEFLFDDLEYKIEEIYFEEKEENIYISGTMLLGEISLGYISFNIDVPLGVTSDLLQLYVKKVNKIKTILEAVK